MKYQNKSFYKSTDDSFCRSIVGREGKFIHRVSIYFSKKKCCSFYDGNGSIGWCSRGLVLHHGPSVGLRCWQMGHSAIDASRLLSMSSCCWWMCNLHPCHNGTLFMSSLGNDEGGWGRTLIEIHRMGHPIYLFNKMLFFCWSQSLMSIYMRSRYLQTSCLFGEVYPHTFFPGLLVATFPVMFPMSSWISSQLFTYSLWISVDLCFWLCSNI